MELKKVGVSDRLKLYSLMQKYLYELSAYYDIPMDENGDFIYKYFETYFTEPARSAYFFVNEGKTVGFCLINDYSFTAKKADNNVAEFTVFPVFRNRDLGEEAVRLLKQERQGSWQLKFSENNRAAAAFWRKIGRKYNGKELALPGGETALSFE
jgi:predicted acetyltransferase